jgi:molybdopterin converting factor small subunit
MAIVTLRYWAAAKEAAGIAEEAVSAGTLAEALAAALAAATGDADGGGGPDGAAGPDRRDEREARNARLRAILVRSSFLVDGNPVGTRAPEAVVLGDGSVVEVLPPFAGG